MVGVNVKVKGMERFSSRLREIAAIRAQTQVGFFEKAKYPNGTSVAYVAYLNEYGGHNPPRPFLKRTYRKNIKKWTKGIIVNIKHGGFNKSTVIRAYKMAGMVAVSDVKKTIATWNPSDPYPNDHKTIRAKERRGRSSESLEAIDPTRVLIDSGRMISSIQYEVKT